MDKHKNRLVQQAVGFVKYFANLTAWYDLGILKLSFI